MSHRSAVALIALVAALLAGFGPAGAASSSHDEPAARPSKTEKAAKPAKAAPPAADAEADADDEEAPPAAPAKAASAPRPIHTMEDLRQRLQEKIAQVKVAPPARAGAKPAPLSGSASELVLTVPAPPPAPTPAAAPARPVAKAAPARPAGRPATPAGHKADTHWSYGGEGAPAHWGSLKPEFATCATGNRQSPIDIRGGIRVDLEPIQFDYRPVSFHVIDNGHTVQANLAPGNSIVVGSRRYELVQFHFHRPSEETINGRHYEMVAHLVHKDAEGRLAVVAVLMDQGKAHPMVQLVWNSLPLEQQETVLSPAPIDMNLMLPEDRRYYTYMGSLTTPPCSEGVRWMVLKQPATMSADQIGIFARLYPMNARPIQQAGGRLIKESN